MKRKVYTPPKTTTVAFRRHTPLLMVTSVKNTDGFKLSEDMEEDH